MGIIGGIARSVGGFVNAQVSDAVRSAVRWAGLVLLALAALSVHTWWRQRKARKRVDAQCGSGSGASVFVALLGERSSAATAQALYALFEGASCPQRIRVGLYELVPSGAPPASSGAVDLYRGMVERYSAAGVSFHSRVTVMRRMPEDQGPYGALWELLQHAYEGEAYVLTLSDGALLQRGWDAALVRALERAPQRTCLVLPAGGGFPVLAGFEDGVPVLGQRPFVSPEVVGGSNSSNSSRDLVPVKYWTRDASFAPAGMWVPPSPAAMPCRRQALQHLLAGSEVLVSAEAVQRGWRMATLPASELPLIVQPAAVGAPSAWRPSKASREAADRARALLHSSAALTSALAGLGLHGSVSKDAVLGIVDSRDTDEVTAKYASLAEYLYIASKLGAP